MEISSFKIVHFPATPHIEALELAINWMEAVVAPRMGEIPGLPDHEPNDLPSLPGNFPKEAELSRFIHRSKITKRELAVILLAILPEFRPGLIRDWQLHTKARNRLATIARFHSEIICPSVETALYILAGDHLQARVELWKLLATDSFLISNNILQIIPTSPLAPRNLALIRITPEYLHLFTTGQELKPRFSSEFPAKRMQTTLEWDDLVLSGDARKQVAEIKLWLQHKEAFLGEWEMSRKFKPGYSALFHGPPGTGKTMTASLLGKATGRDVYRIDLSSVISKYIGETEKNLARIFDLAENKEWILFFDEADSLFGKRGKVSDARDRYANQDISFLLQRLEDFNGLSILASNLKSNIDEAFMRRFQAIIYFPLPNPEMRYQLWKQAIPKRAKLERKVKILELAHKYELTGAAIMNVVRHATLKTIDGGDEIMREEYLMEGIKREYFKVGKVV